METFRETQKIKRNNTDNSSIRRQSTINPGRSSFFWSRRQSLFREEKRGEVNSFTFSEILKKEVKTEVSNIDERQKQKEENPNEIYSSQMTQEREPENTQIRQTLNKILKLYSKIKQEDLSNTKAILKSKEELPLIPIQKDSEMRKQARRTFAKKELRPFNKETMVASCFTRGLNKALLLLGTHKHQNPSEIDFQLSNTISLGNPKKNISDGFDYFEFIDNCPLVFQRLRYSEGISNEEYIKKIGFKNFKTMFSGKMVRLKHQKSAGQSGSFFLVSSCGKFFVKSIRKQEWHTLKKVLPSYFRHLQANPKSLLNRFYGFYELRFWKNTKLKQSIYFVVMNNLFFDVNQIVFPDRVFDLKGSTYKREVKCGGMNFNVPGKDLDFIRFQRRHNLVFKIEENKRRELISNLYQDSMFLANHNIIDYRYWNTNMG
jgi:hypothetical protein